MSKILISGAQGRMGQEAVLAVEADPQLQFVGDALRGHDLAKRIEQFQPDVVLDLTLPETVFQNCQTIIQHGVHPVIGTSGLTPAQVGELQAQCAAQQLGGVIAPNFSLGAMLMMKMAALAAQYLPAAEIVEIHHDKKIDSPSGTATKTAEIIANHRGQTYTAPHTDGPARGFVHQDVPIHALRLPGLVAHQQVIFGGDHESLTIQHDSLHRKSFMPGVIMACKKVRELNTLVYGLENLL